MYFQFTLAKMSFHAYISSKWPLYKPKWPTEEWVPIINLKLSTQPGKLFVVFFSGVSTFSFFGQSLVRNNVVKTVNPSLPPFIRIEYTFCFATEYPRSNTLKS